MHFRPETAEDREVIAALIEAAFAGAAHASGREAEIVAGLRRAGGLTLSLVAEDQGAVVGHVAFSPVSIAGEGGAAAADGWFGLGPVAVRPDRQRGGVGTGLIHAGLARLRDAGARGCVVLGDPAYYRRFGFAPDPALRLDGVPPEYFMRLVLAGPLPAGRVTYHPAFDRS
ncbi:GNAT family N-acetyltransferase [Paracoccus sp. S-4012]|uniref:GNAT family N-acetyltransferase n=1 Tax=Paracoccus sp. S-4012 TaxID=2665648 RepID=UPI0012AFB54B|nr:N-acetyltransferase [Paracoccus sp. S-4012]MRX50708.1 GNAT family N-acetyltransferase [Paracoccus sp. S-4012]